MTIDEFSIPALTQLENVTVRSVLEDELRKLNSSLPTLDEVRDKLDSLCVSPFSLAPLFAGQRLTYSLLSTASTSRSTS